MNKKAEEAALKAYPCIPMLNCYKHPKGGPADGNEINRRMFQEGYEQAEKDLALSWEDIDEIIGIFENMKEQIIALKLDDETLCKEVLKRFNEQRNGRINLQEMP